MTAQIGVGGMGAVYRATDTKPKRQVAPKILLPETSAADPDPLARFQREAQVLVSLDHPNIAAIYGLEQGDGAKALVLELGQEAVAVVGGRVSGQQPELGDGARGVACVREGRVPAKARAGGEVMRMNNTLPIGVVLYCGFVIALLGAVAIGQGTFVPGEDNAPPTETVKVFSYEGLQSAINGDLTGRLLEGQELFSMNLLHRTGEEPTVHGRVADLYFVQEGSGVLESGGTLVNPTPTGGRPGDVRGTGIRGGTTQTIKKGDVVFIPPGVPHRWVAGQSDIWYLNTHFPGK